MNPTDESVVSATPDGFRSLMTGFPTGVTIVTAVDSLGSPRGFTCSAMCPVALDPPTLLICVRAQSPTLEAILHQGTFSVNLLRHDAQSAAELFASGAVDRFDRVRWWPKSDGGPHLIDAAHSIADCRVVDSHGAGDHRIVLGEVASIWRQPGHLPLLYGLRRYASWPTA
jgi:flavin reductase (DIM6/NTAB) family NADH-FMN oxidoreductase RutF